MTGGLPSGASRPLVNVWLAQGDVDGEASRSHLLSSAERKLVGTKRWAIDQARSATGRVLLKHLLAQDFGIDPLSVHLVAGNGVGSKPNLCFIQDSGTPMSLRANISHAGDQVVVAVTDGVDVGVDVEEHASTSFHGFDNIALSGRERAIVADLPPHLRSSARANFWVCKEAVVKALGVGMLAEPADICVAGVALSSLQPVAHPEISVQLIESREGYSAAVSVCGAGIILTHTSASVRKESITSQKYAQLETKDRLC